MTAKLKIVKELDDSENLMIAHIGLDLWRAAIAWRDRLHREMVARGHAFYGDARSAVIVALDPAGLSQSVLVSRMAMSKQAVQQLLDGLESDGIIRRESDPADGRGKRVVYTAKGRAALKDGVKVKRDIEREIRSRLGDRAFEALRKSLHELASA